TLPSSGLRNGFAGNITDLTGILLRTRYYIYLVAPGPAADLLPGGISGRPENDLRSVIFQIIPSLFIFDIKTYLDADLAKIRLKNRGRKFAWLYPHFQ